MPNQSMPNTVRATRVHRFGDQVALYLEDHGTVYISPELAKGLGRTLEEYGFDCQNIPFRESELSGTEMLCPHPQR